MELKEIQERKSELEATILRLCKEFEGETGTNISSINLTSLCSGTIGGPYISEIDRVKLEICI